MRYRIVDCDGEPVASANEAGDADTIRQGLSDLHPWGRPFEVVEDAEARNTGGGGE